MATKRAVRRDDSPPDYPDSDSSGEQVVTTRSMKKIINAAVSAAVSKAHPTDRAKERKKKAEGPRRSPKELALLKKEECLHF